MHSIYDPILALLRDLAEQDGNIQAAALSGSRTDPGRTPDGFSDYDIVLFTGNLTASMAQNYPARLEEQLGPLLIMQQPDREENENSGYYTYLCQFADCRIDLRLMRCDLAAWYFSVEPGLTVLWDEAQLCEGLTAPGPELFALHRPDRTAFENCCNEFFWTALYVVKGLCRGQLDYAAWHIDRCVRAELIRMIGFDRCFESGYTLPLGVGNKYLPQLLTAEEHTEFAATYSLGSLRDCADALLLAIRLFLHYGKSAAKKLGFSLPDYALPVQNTCRRLLGQYHVL